MAKHGTAGPDDGRSVVSNRTMEIAVAAILLAFGATFLYSSYRLGFRWSSDGPQSGFFPFYVSLFICVASAAILLQAIFSRDPKARSSFVERGHRRVTVLGSGLRWSRLAWTTSRRFSARIGKRLRKP